MLALTGRVVLQGVDVVVDLARRDPHPRLHVALHEALHQQLLTDVLAELIVLEPLLLERAAELQRVHVVAAGDALDGAVDGGRVDHDAELACPLAEDLPIDQALQHALGEHRVVGQGLLVAPRLGAQEGALGAHVAREHHALVDDGGDAVDRDVLGAGGRRQGEGRRRDEGEPEPAGRSLVHGRCLFGGGADAAQSSSSR